MTPIEEYAQKRAEVVVLIEKYAPERLQAQLIELLRPAIALKANRCADDKIPVGKSKFGGAPDVPDDFKWPTWNENPLGFLAQINLREVAPFDEENRLPKVGLLLFFLSFDEDAIWGEARQSDGWRVILVSDRNLESREVPPASQWIVPLFPQKIEVSGDWLLDVFNGVDSLDWTESEWRDFHWNTLPFQMFGPPNAPQISPFVVAVNGNQGRNDFDLYQEGETIWQAEAAWLLLLQMDTARDGFFADIHDLGGLYFMIRHEDLAAADFSKVWFNQQST